MANIDTINVGGTDYGIAAAELLSSAVLSVVNGGTGLATLTSGRALIGNGTGAVSLRAITNNTSAAAIAGNTNLPTCNTVLNGIIYNLGRSTAVNAADTNYTNLMARGESLNASDTTPAVNGAIAWTYE